MDGQSEYQSRPPVRVLIVDDSATMRQLIRAVIATDPRLAVVGTAENAREARDAVKALAPDVMTLDVEMPGMNGLEFLDRLMRARPMPVVMLSSLTAKGSAAALEALSLGAVDCVQKPAVGATDRTFSQLTQRLVDAASAHVGAARRARVPQRECLVADWHWNKKIVLIGASTGGVEALETVLASFPPNCPPTLITQHMPEHFLASFAARLNATRQPDVHLATDGDRLRPGHVYLAPGGATHLVIEPDGLSLRLQRGPKRSGHRPSVDAMFDSAVPLAGRVVAAILTGMGRDGAAAMSTLHSQGAYCIGQDRDTSVVFGMPRVAQELGALDAVLPLAEIGPELLRRTSASAARQE